MTIPTGPPTTTSPTRSTPTNQNPAPSIAPRRTSRTRTTKRKTWLAVIAAMVAVAIGTFGLTTATRTADKPAARHMVEKISDAAEHGRPLTFDVVMTPKQRAELMVAVSFGGADGISIHENIDWHGVIHEGFTLQPVLVAKIYYYIKSHPYQSALASVLLGAAACIWFSASIAGGIICSALFATFQTYLLDQIQAAAVYGGCITVKIKFSLFTVPNFVNPIWDSFPYADFGSWCDLRKNIPWPPGVTYNGDVTPPCVPYPECNV